MKIYILISSEKSWKIHLLPPSSLASSSMSMIDKSKVVIKLNLPSGRDINDLSKEEFDKMWEEQVVNYKRIR